MKNLKYLNCDEIAELKKIINGKHHITRQKLTNIIWRIEAKYNLYLNEFNNIHNLPPNDFDIDESSALKGCYTIDTEAKETLIKSIIMAQTVHFQDVCVYCLINTRSTIDHYIPETSFPVFSILVKNLLPCCSICNQKKLEYWRDNNNRAIIHYYNELSLNIQFLFGSLSFNEHNTPIITFELRNDNNIPYEKYFIVETHFKRLELLNRYHDKIDLVISNVKDDIETNKLELGDLITNAMISNILIRKANKMKEHFGTNYWKAIAINLLANSELFLNSIKIPVANS